MLTSYQESALMESGNLESGADNKRENVSESMNHFIRSANR